MKLILILCSLFVMDPIFGQTLRQHVQLKWEAQQNKSIKTKIYTTFYTEQGCALGANLLPVYSKAFAIQGDKNVSVTMENATYGSIPNNDIQQADLIKNTVPELKWEIAYEQKNPRIIVQFIPLRRNTGQLEKLESFDLVIHSTQGNNQTAFAKAGFANQSVLANGDWYKILVNQTGIQRIDKTFLKSLGINADDVDPRTIKIYGNGPGLIPSLNKNYRIDDLKENPIIVEGESDGKFDEGDAILFYGKSQMDVWTYDSASTYYKHQTNYYADATVYFLTFGNSTGKRITTVASATPNQINDGHYDFLFIHENESVNLIRTGKRWLGEEFNRELNQTFQVNCENADLALPAFIRSVTAARSFSSSSFDLKVNGNYIFNQFIPLVDPNFEMPYAADNSKSATFTLGSSNLNVDYYYNQPIPGSIGWLDNFEVQTRNYLNLNKAQLLLRDKKSIGFGKITQFNLVANGNTQVWDVTDPTNATKISTTFASNTHTFSIATDSLKEFLAFDGSAFVVPKPGSKINNQNIHGLPFADFFIVSHDEFLSEANRLADFHRQQGMTVNVVSIDQVYNEFSSGVQDIAAVRDMMRMFYKKASIQQEMPKYLLLFGRASYDYKSRISNNTNFIPTFESDNSFDPVNSYCSDDYLGLLDDNEGSWDIGNNPNEILDIGIGRLPATNMDNAAGMVNKIINYNSSPDRNDWKNRLTFVADDEDGNIHESQADGLAENARSKYKNYNVQKIFIDAFPEVTTAGGARNPSAQAEIVKSVERGCFLVNYNGHGGEVGWAAERILNTDDIQGWTNGLKLPLFFTATCEFSRFDDPARFSAGEYVLLNKNGGGIALFTTVRLVDAGNNFSLNTAFYKYAGLDSASMGKQFTLGEIMRRTKNDVLSTNSRNFTLLGDPAMKLAYPQQSVYTTSVNNKPIITYSDTLKAFSKVTISGKVTDGTGAILTTYNGIVYPTVYDKVANYNTVVNNPDHSAPFQFKLQSNVLYRGSATVTNGLFTFDFIVPKDIGYQIGTGRISYYAENGNIDAAGYDERILVGSTADSSGVDQIGPDIKLFLNDEKFVFGGITNESPLFIAKLKDITGINITGVGLGRELSLELNNNTASTISMNDYYRAKTDSYQEGEVRYQIKGLAMGKNSLKLGAWDVHNNYSESVLDFIVANSADIALQHVLNYPNPFTTSTTFHFDHNKPFENLNVMVQIFTISGKLIKTLHDESLTSGSHFDKLTWDGKDEYGDGIGKGVYIYKVKVKATNGKSAEEFQKLVILN